MSDSYRPSLNSMAWYRSKRYLPDMDCVRINDNVYSDFMSALELMESYKGVLVELYPIPANLAIAYPITFPAGQGVIAGEAR